MMDRARKPPLHFAHANGFPGACYRKLFDYLSPHYDVGAIPMIGHNPRYPVTDGWTMLVMELIAHLESRYTQPVIGVGHSLGGFLTFLAAIARPDLFRAIVLMDAPVLGFFKSKVLAMTKALGAIDRVTPAGATRDRRAVFPTRAAAYAHFRSRRVFRRFDDDCLDHYIQYGAVESEAGVRLRYDPYIETRIYRTIPHDLYRLRGKLEVAAGFMVRRDSALVAPADLGYMKRSFRMQFSRVDGGHLFPFQFPRMTAVKLHVLIHRLESRVKQSRESIR